MIKSKRMRWLRYAALLGREQEYIEDFRGKTRRKETTRRT
jgi:hypothetical protein